MKKIGVSAVSTIIGAAVGAGAAGKVVGDKLEKAQNMSNKHLVLFKMMNQWVRVKQEGKNLSEYFEKNGYKNIAIYGMSYAGETLVYELADTNTHVLYGIDKNAQSLYMDVDIVEPNNELEEVDAIVVTAVSFFDEIEEMLSKKVDCPIISLEDVLYEV
jgi:hypothetical protein